MRPGALLLLLCVGACATAGPTPPQAGRGSAAQAAPTHGQSVPRPVRRQPDAAALPTGGVWRVVADGTTACADPGALQLLREAPAGDAAALRRLAAARARGGCVTVFRNGSWRLVDQRGALMRLSPADGGASLYFWRDEVAEERPI
jgi:hypothetical protein